MSPDEEDNNCQQYVTLGWSPSKIPETLTRQKKTPSGVHSSPRVRYTFRRQPINRLYHVDQTHYPLEHSTVLLVMTSIFGLFSRVRRWIAQVAEAEQFEDCGNNPDDNHLAMLVDSGASRHYFDYEINPRLKDSN